MKKILFIAFIALGLGSCTKYLDVKTYGKAVPKTSEEFSALLHTHLNNIDFGVSSPLLDNATDLVNMEVITDNFSVALTTPAGTVLPKYIGSLINNKQSRYERLYSVIRDANIIINNMLSVSTLDERNVMGTAYAMRAIAYYQLLREYCEPYTSDNQLGVPLVSDFDMEERPIRSTYGQTIALISSDFDKALSFKVSDEIFRYTEDVTKAYQARFYFWIKDWENAARISSDIVKKYPLLNGQAYSDMIQSKNAKVGNVLLKSYLFSGNTDVEFSSNQGIIQARPLSKDFVDLFVEKDRDIRYRLSFNPLRLNQKMLNGKVRSAEFQLIIAESYAHLGKSDLALAEINLFRSKRISKYVNLTTNDLPAVSPLSLILTDAEGKELTPLLQLILNERRKELYAEGDRFFELKRNGRPVFWAADNGLKYTTEKYMYTFPLPRIDIEVVQGLIQNDGYKL
ncbi:RagB/SusD family nutrient uptake outer membrane protein [Sphingobacterium tabacisoli]|uniref:RagB/SusD family nutrient uptake outer membrane protein n=1 Tax=Sphingobacterium tabacisoli TaxID=2044855 RepID=A0ABW5L1I5_9SPHI|nr:RagB/SusD family nutrient uptake outer membrane protein [Sphingobacterium tabacisoli]